MLDGELTPTLISLGLGYLLGSIPFGLLISKAMGQGDIRSIGSGNIGATNVLRTGRKDLAFITLLLDAGKAGFAFILVDSDLFGIPFSRMLANWPDCLRYMAVIRGHNTHVIALGLNCRHSCAHRRPYHGQP